MHDGQRLRVAAAIVAIVYTAIQAFQEYVYRTLPEPTTPVDGLMLGHHPLHIARSTIMLAAMFGLIFLYAIVALQRAKERPVLAGFTFLAFLLFGFLEIGLRSIELIWTQLQLPALYAQSHDPAILDQVSAFESVQNALYLPLGFSVLVGSVLGVWLFSTGRRLDRVVQAVFVVNILRNALRQLTVYAGVNLFPSAAYEHLYFPLVVVFYLPLAYWLVTRSSGSDRVPDDAPA